MLENLKNDLIKISSDSEPFNQHFIEYVMQVQDSNIELEISYLLSHNIVSALLIDRAIADAFKGMMS